MPSAKGSTWHRRRDDDGRTGRATARDPLDVDAAMEADHQNEATTARIRLHPRACRACAWPARRRCAAKSSRSCATPGGGRLPRDAQLAAQPRVRRRPDHRGQRAARRAADLPPPKPKTKGEPKEQPSTPSIDELHGLINVGEEIVHLLLDDERTHVVVMDGYPQGQIYARFAACLAGRCLKLRRASRHVTMPRMTAPADAICKAALARFKKCRSVEKMRAAAEVYYYEELADRFP